MMKTLVAASALLIAGAANAGMIDLGIGGANVFTSGDFKGKNNQTAGAVVAGGNVDLSSFALNNKNQTAYDGYALVAGGKLTINNGSLNNGKIYTGGGKDLQQGVGQNGVTDSNVLPLTFSATAAHAPALSAELDTLGVTGSAKSDNNKLYLTGSGSAVEVFDLNAADLNGKWMSVSGIAAGATVIVNFSGDFDGAIKSLGDFGSANVLYNFTDALKLEFANINVAGSVLAPNAVIGGANGQIGGNVVASGWNSQLTLTGSNYFKPVDASGFDLPAAAVPEPSTLLLMALGLSAVAFFARRQSLRSKP